MNRDQAILATVRANSPEFIAIYAFGSSGTEYERPESDVDIALLLPVGVREPEQLRQSLEAKLNRSVDLIDLRKAPNVLQKEIVLTGRRLACVDPYAADQFEMQVMSAYQKLSQERSEIVAAGLQSGRFYGR